MSSSRLRLDHVLVERGLAPTRSRARAVIMAGKVRVGGQAASKPGTLVTSDDHIELIAAPRFVGRGGDKLAAAIDELLQDFGVRRASQERCRGDERIS